MSKTASAIFQEKWAKLNFQEYSNLRLLDIFGKLKNLSHLNFSKMDDRQAYDALIEASISVDLTQTKVILKNHRQYEWIKNGIGWSILEKQKHGRPPKELVLARGDFISPDLQGGKDPGRILNPRKRKVPYNKSLPFDKQKRGGNDTATSLPSLVASTEPCVSPEKQEQQPIPYNPGHPTTPKVRKTRRALSPHSKCLLYGDVCALGEKPRHGSLKKLAKLYGVNPRLPKRLLSKMQQGIGHDQSHVKKPGRKRKITGEVAELLNGILKENHYDISYRELGEKLHLAPSTVLNFMHANKYRKIGKYVRPVLNDSQKLARLTWATEHLDDDFDTTCDIDEKWFYSIRSRGNLKVPPGTQPPRMPIKSKRFISKVMCITAIAKPRPEFGFDGKCGIWVFAEEDVAKRSSKNRGKGSKVLRPYEVTGDVWAEMLATKVFPAIRRKMSFAQRVIVQVDNARPHVKKSIQDRLREAGRNKRGVNGTEIVVCPQPSQSPDLNLNDLGFFASFDTHIGHTRSFDLLKFWALIQEAFSTFPSEKLDKLVRTKQAIIQEIVRHNGSNDFKLPHYSNKTRM